MRTRRGLCYPRPMDLCAENKMLMKRGLADRPTGSRLDFSRKRIRLMPEIDEGRDLLDSLPDDLVLTILCKLSSAAQCPADFVNVLVT